jgi:excisionase family DNA binding protein
MLSLLRRVGEDRRYPFAASPRDTGGMMNGLELQVPATEARVIALSPAGAVTRGRKPTDSDDHEMPPVLDLPEAAALLGVGRTTAYRLVREQQWPTPVLRLGRLIKIPTQPLLDLLHGNWPSAEGAPLGRTDGRT